VPVRIAGKTYRPDYFAAWARARQGCARRLKLTNAGEQVHCRHVHGGRLLADNGNRLVQRRIVNQLHVQRAHRGDCRHQQLHLLVDHHILFLEQAGVDDRPALVDGSKEETPVFGAHSPTDVCAEVNH